MVYAYGDSDSFSTVVNPFLGVEVNGNISWQWEPSDWGLLQVLNTLLPKSAAKNAIRSIEVTHTVERLKKAFDADLPAHASTLHRPNSWAEMLFVPDA